MKQCGPQGDVLSAVLFNLYMTSLPEPSADVNVASYAEDITVVASGSEVAPIVRQVNGYLEDLGRWFEDRHLLLSAASSAATLFTTWNA